jgi:asparagine synthase (glutamine-hydrolysing)
MCGIAGIISPFSPFVQQERLQLMADALQHRGPNGEGFWVNNDAAVGFAHRRLAIIDLTENGKQPFHYLHYTLIYNGEIYNYLELRNELIQKGYSFQTQTDTEIIPAAYDCWGKDCLNYFDGMFAFALFDEKQNEVFIARDRFGEKPLYYYADYKERGKFEQFLFSSEMKALWKVAAPKHLSGMMMLNYLTLGYTQNPLKKTETFYSDILSLPAGHYLSVFPKEGKVRMKKWYEMKTENEDSRLENAEERFRELFFSSVEKRLRSDVSAGTSLSGGVDSSSIVAAIDVLKKTKTVNEHWKNVGFTAIFPGFEKDESKQSKIVADHFGIKQFTVAPNENDWLKYFDELMYHQEEPLQSSSVLTQFLIYKLAKENNITVLLDGQGADEILGGYKKYVHWFLQQLFLNNKKDFSHEKKILEQNNFLEEWNLKNYAASYFPSKAALQLQHRAIAQQNENDFINKDFLHQYQNKDSLQKPVVRNLEDILYYNTFHVGLEELLRYADRNSMAHSREVRLPFLNHELVEFIFSLPSSFKIKNGFTKWILRQSMDNILPKEIAWQKDKIGYEPPQKKWMQNKKIQEKIMESRKKLIHEKVLDKSAETIDIAAKNAHEANNFDWRFLCAAEIF